MSLVALRNYDAARDEEAAIALWLETWQKTYPDIDFAKTARLVAPSNGATTWCRLRASWSAKR